ncbi:MAG: hypothetical protein K0U59_08670 [Gammaproteobacteria bacterium]|nr:hypothetical protein [Gammaproteobacteria bacterium]
MGSVTSSQNGNSDKKQRMHSKYMLSIEVKAGKAVDVHLYQPQDQLQSMGEQNCINGL